MLLCDSKVICFLFSTKLFKFSEINESDKTEESVSSEDVDSWEEYPSELISSTEEACNPNLNPAFDLCSVLASTAVFIAAQMHPFTTKSTGTRSAFIWRSALASLHIPFMLADTKAVGPYTLVIQPGWGWKRAGVIIPGRTMQAGICPHSATIASSAQAFVKVYVLGNPSSISFSIPASCLSLKNFKDFSHVPVVDLPLVYFLLYD